MECSTHPTPQGVARGEQLLCFGARRSSTSGRCEPHCHINTSTPAAVHSPQARAGGALAGAVRRLHRDARPLGGAPRVRVLPAGAPQGQAVRLLQQESAPQAEAGAAHARSAGGGRAAAAGIGVRVWVRRGAPQHGGGNHRHQVRARVVTRCGTTLGRTTPQVTVVWAGRVGDAVTHTHACTCTRTQEVWWVGRKRTPHAPEGRDRAPCGRFFFFGSTCATSGADKAAFAPRSTRLQRGDGTRVAQGHRYRRCARSRSPTRAAARIRLHGIAVYARDALTSRTNISTAGKVRRGRGAAAAPPPTL